MTKKPSQSPRGRTRSRATAKRLLSVEQLEARRLLATNIGAVRVDAGSDFLQWNLDNETLEGNSAAEISFAYGLKAGVAGAGSNGDDYALAGDFSGDGFDQAIAVRGIGGSLQWLGDTDRDTTHEYLFRFGLDNYKPLTADLNGDGYDDIIAVTSNGAALEWHVHYWVSAGNPGAFGGGTTDYFSDSTLETNATFTFGLNNTDIPLVGDVNNDGKADVVVARDDGSNFDWYVGLADSGSDPFPNPSVSELASLTNFGGNTTIPVIGNWDSTGSDNFGFVTESVGESLWSLDTDYNSGIESTVSFGNSGDQYIVGNWSSASVSLNAGGLLFSDSSEEVNSWTISSSTATSEHIFASTSEVIYTDIVGATGSGTTEVRVPFSTVTSPQIEIYTAGGNDLVTVASDFAPGITYDLSIDGGEGDDGINWNSSSQLESIQVIAEQATLIASARAIGISTWDSPINLPSNNIAMSGSVVTLLSTIDGPAGMTFAPTSTGSSISGALGSNTPMSAFTANGEVTLSGGAVTTTGDQRYYRGLYLDAASNLTTLTSNNGGAIAFQINSGRFVRSVVDGQEGLVINTAGQTIIDAPIGNGSRRLASLTTNSVGSTLLSSNVNTTGDQIYNDASLLVDDVNLTSANGTVRFGQAIEGSTAGGESLTISANAYFYSHVGNSVELATLTVTGSTVTNTDQRTIRTTGAQTYNGPFVATSTRTLTSTAGGDITFASTVDAPTNGLATFSVNTAGVTSFLGDVGTNHLLGSITTDAAGSTVFAGSTVITRNSQTYNDAVILQSSTNFSALEVGFPQSADLTFNDVSVGTNSLTAIANTTLTVNGDISATGAGDVTLTSNGNLTVAAAGSVTTENGNLLLSANQGTPNSGDFSGIVVAGLVESTGSGDTTVLGRGGDHSSGFQHGVHVRLGGDIIGGTSGALTVTGTGGANAGGQNHGVYVEGSSSTITSNGGPVSVTGTGGAGSGNGNLGVGISTSNASISSGGGNIDVTGTGGAGPSSYGVSLAYTGTITSSGGGITIVAAGNATSAALQLSNAGVIQSLGSAAVNLSADSLNLESGSISSGSGSITLNPLTSGTRIDLGGADVLTGSPLTLGLTDSELDQITATDILIGDVSSDSITVSGSIEHAGDAHFSLYSAGDMAITTTGSWATDGGDLSVDATGTITLDGSVTAAGTGEVSLTTERNIIVNSTGGISVVNGDLKLLANRQAIVTVGDFDGVRIDNATLETTGSGNILIEGTSGNTSDDNGVVLVSGGNSRVLSTASDATAGTITIIGDSTAPGGYHGGLSLEDFTRIETVTGDVDLTGSAVTWNGFRGLGQIHSTGTGANAANISVYGASPAYAGIYMDVLTVTTVDGDVSLNGVSTGSAWGVRGPGNITSSGTGPGAGTITITGSTVSGFAGVSSDRTITSADGDIVISSPQSIRIHEISSTAADIVVSGSGVDIQSQVQSDAGDISLTATAGIFSAYGDIESASGTITIDVSGNAILGAGLTTAGSEIAIDAGNGVSMQATASINTQGGNLSIDADADGNGSGTFFQLAGVDLVTNGSFESFTGTTPDNWNASGQLGYEGGYGATDGALALLFNWPDDTISGVISQTMTTVPGQTYLLSFDFGMLGLNAAQTAALQVDVFDGAGFGGSQIIDASVSDSSASVPTQFSRYVYSFKAISASTTLRFSDISTGDHSDSDAALDSVSVTAVGAIDTGSGASTLTGSSLLLRGAVSGDSITLDSNTVSIDGRLAADYTVADGATLGGSGAITGNVNVEDGATLAPGNSPGILNTGDFNLAEGAILEIELGGPTPGNNPSNHDQVNVTGTVTLAGILDVKLFNGFQPESGHTFTIINNDDIDLVSGIFDGLENGSSFEFENVTYTINYFGGDGNDVVLSAEFTTFIVTNGQDATGQPGTLRTAILAANALPGSDRIVFEIPVADPGYDDGQWFITPVTTDLPNITDSVIIDGTSAVGYGGEPVIVLEGMWFSSLYNGLTIAASEVTVRGLEIRDFHGYGIYVTGPSSSNILLEDNLIDSNFFAGIVVDNGASDVHINRNQITANSNDFSGTSSGIDIFGPDTTRVLVTSNVIGLDWNGSARGNYGVGIQIQDSHDNTIGMPGEGNVISGNEANSAGDGSGILITGSRANGNLVQSNYVGTSLDGSESIANEGNGIVIEDGASGNVIGGSDAGTGNVISGNARLGVWIRHVTSADNEVIGNIIGLDATGGDSTIYGIGNVWDGVRLSDSSTLVRDNVISNNLDAGVRIEGYGSGIDSSAVSWFTGEDEPEMLAGQELAFNGGATSISGWNANALNFNGVDAVVDLPGSSNGPLDITDSALSIEAWVELTAYSQPANGENLQVILDKHFAGGPGGYLLGLVDGHVRLKLSTEDTAEFEMTSEEQLTLNSWTHIAATYDGSYARIYIDGFEVLSEALTGSIASSPFDAAIGNSSFGGTNKGLFGSIDELAVYDNALSATRIAQLYAADGFLKLGALVTGNIIGLDPQGATNYGNATGIVIDNSPANVIGGQSASNRNIISGNTGNGIEVFGADSFGNLLQGNYIGTDRSGQIDRGNDGSGVVFYDDAWRNILGGNQLLGEGNVISGNDGNGVSLGFLSSSSEATLVLGNTIGLAQDGDTLLGNSGDGISISEGLDNSNNRIGGYVAGQGNTVSGNARGIVVSGTGTEVTLIVGNRVGTNRAASASKGNLSHGIVIESGASYTLVGGPEPGAQNVVSGNQENGIYVKQPGEGTIIQGNFIGTRAAGSLPLGNGVGGSGFGGIQLESTGINYVEIGGLADPAEGNIISGNSGFGIELGADASVTSHLVQGNLVGVGVGGTSTIPNSTYGIRVLSSGNTLEANVVGGNLQGGILVADESIGDGKLVDANLLIGNSIGTDRQGIASLGNQGHGIEIIRVSNTDIGGVTFGDANVIAFNTGDGVSIFGTSDNSGLTAEETTGLLRNSIYQNGGLGIDLLDLGVLVNGPGNTLNDTTDIVLDFPVIDSATINDGELTLTGFVGAGATFAVYLASAQAGTEFGQGKTYVATFTEGVSDNDSRIDSYGPDVNGVSVVKNGGSILSPRFSFTVPVPNGVSTGSLLTAVGVAGTAPKVSEFGPIIIVGEQTSALAPEILFDESTAAVAIGDRLQIGGRFLDADSTSWTATVDYGDGASAVPLALTANRTFELDHVYTTKGNFVVTVTVTDNSLVTGTNFVNVAVADTAPTATFNQFDVQGQVFEGQLAAFSGEFTNENPNAKHDVTIDWDDGTQDVLELDAGVQSFITTHEYLDDGGAGPERVYSAAVTISSDGGSSTTPVGLYLVQVKNVPVGSLVVTPTATPVSEGGVLTLTGSFFDPGVLDNHTVRVDWGDNSCTPTTCTFDVVASGADGATTKPLPVLSHTYLDDPASGPDEYSVTVEVWDKDEPSSPATYSQNFAVANVAPTDVSLSITQNGAPVTSINEGGTIALSGSFLDAGTKDSYRVFIDWGDQTKSTIDLGTNVKSFSGITHHYLDDPNGLGANYTITVRVADNDQIAAQVPEASYGLGTTTIDVANVDPILSNVRFFKQGSSIELGAAESINEGDSIFVTGRVDDIGQSDRQQVEVNWGDGKSSLATIAAQSDPLTGLKFATFRAAHAYGDDFDPAQIEITVKDGRFEPSGAFQPDGAAPFTTFTKSLVVNNVSPLVEIDPALGSTPTNVTLLATVIDPGVDEFDEQNPESILDKRTYSWEVDAGTGFVTATATGPALHLNSEDYTIPPRIRVTVSDGIASGSYEMEAVFATNASETILVTASDFTIIDDATDSVTRSGPLTGLTQNILVMGFAGTDTLDARPLPETRVAVLDGGQEKDFLFGGAGPDRFFAHDGDDETDGGAGDDYYKFKPNSTLTVIDTQGENTLDFSLADFGDTTGIQFDLTAVLMGSLITQDVSMEHAGEHFVRAQGSFKSLVGSNFGDTLTAASGSTVSAGGGKDLIKVVDGTTNGSFRGGADDDIFEVRGTDIANLNFGGDEGIDELVNFGHITNLVFNGGADDDIFTNSLDAVVNGLHFGGDEGIDLFENLGTINALTFSGGADNDIFTNGLGATINDLSFGGDEGADVFTNLGTVAGTLTFNGGADNDVFENAAGASIAGLVFGGDDGADLFRNLGTITGALTFSGGADDDQFTNTGSITGTLIFNGGADDDIFTNHFGATLANINFGGDEGLDIFENLGVITGSLEFNGGADDDLFENTGAIGNFTFNGGADDDIFRNQLGAEIGGLTFGGDAGADLLENFGSVTTLVFNGGADDDVLTNAGDVTTLTFSGDEGVDVFNNRADVGALEFNGGADNDIFTNDSNITTLTYRGDTGDDLFENSGTASTLIFTGGADNDIFSNTGEIVELQFTGGADDDIFVNHGKVTNLTFFGGNADTSLAGGKNIFRNFGDITDTLIFHGADGDDLFSNAGNVATLGFFGDQGDSLFENSGTVGSLTFTGGADQDVFHNSGNVQTISFEGDAGADLFQNSGEVAELSFGGDLGTDIFQNSGSVTQLLTFAGGADNDVLVNTGLVTKLEFTGGADDDVLQNRGVAIEINFFGDEGIDVVINYGEFEKLDFTGGADDDTFANYGESVGSLNFIGDMDPDAVGFDPEVGGNDKLIIRGSGNGQADATITFSGGIGKDAFQNNAAGFSQITFNGGADDDVFQNNANGISNIHFGGDAGEDVFENNGNAVSNLVFEGDENDDIFVNDGFGVSNISFHGGADDDQFINTSNDVIGLRFYGGHTGVDILANSGDGLTDVSFEGGADNDVFVNTGASLSDVSFAGDGGNDRFWNKAGGFESRNITFLGDIGDDLFINDAAGVTGLTYFGGDNNDGFQNNGANVSSVMVDGGGGNDTVINTGGSLNNLLFKGDTGDDVLSLRGLDAGYIEFHGDEGADRFENSGSGAAELIFLGGQEDDLFSNLGQASSLHFVGNAGDDVLQNNGPIAILTFIGGDNDDLFQNNGDADTLTFEGGLDDDLLVNNASGLAAISFFGDGGSDSLINNGSDIASLVFRGNSGGDYLRLNGNNLGDATFTAGSDGDTFEFNGIGAEGATITYIAGPGNDFLSWLGSADHGIFEGGEGNDLVMVVGSSPDLSLNGQLGNDIYTFVKDPAAYVTIGETLAAEADDSQDTLDFSSFTGGALNLDLQKTEPQQLSDRFTITLMDGLGIEGVVGTTESDVILGNARNNVIYGAEYFERPDPNFVGSRSVTQWVLLDFSTKQDAGEHFYEANERDEIEQRVESFYRGPASLENPWFDVQVTQSLAEITAALGASITEDDYVTIYFNDTPAFGRPGGLASEVDLGNFNLGGSAQVQINGLLGGAITADEANVEVNEDHYHSAHGHATLFGDANVGSLKPEATSTNFVLLSAKIAAHELGHLMGLRHQDSFGPIGYGIHDPPGGDAYNPGFTGPSGAFESFDHLAGSPASIGSSRFTDLNDLFFGERESVKLAFAGSDLEETVVPEQSGIHDSIANAQPLPLVDLQVPNTLSRGLNSEKDYFVQIQSVVGAIDLVEVEPSLFQSENDFFSFEGKQGALFNIDVMSNSLVGRFGSAADDFVDTRVRVFDANGNLIPYFATDAFNDDQFEPTDSSLIDIRLPADGTYYIEVDTFARDANDIIFDPNHPNSPLNPENPNNILGTEFDDLRKRFLDTRDNTDIGQYHLMIYSFAQANREDGTETLKGNGGFDILDGGPDEFFGITIESTSDASLDEGGILSKTISFADPAGSVWTAVVDFGDGSVPAEIDNFDPTTGLTFSHTYRDDSSEATNGVFTGSVTISNENQALEPTVTSFNVEVSNKDPEVTRLDTYGLLLAGAPMNFSGTATDPGLDDPLSFEWNFGDSGGSEGAMTNHAYAEAGTYTTTLVVKDEDGAPDSGSTILTLEAAELIARVNADLRHAVAFIDTLDGTWNATVDFGDGSDSAEYTNLTADQPILLEHVYEQGSENEPNGTFEITINLVSIDGPNRTIEGSLDVYAVTNFAKVYVDDSFTQSSGEVIPDADLGSAGEQPARMGVDAFPTVAEALAVIDDGGVVVVNDGVYPEAIDLSSNVTLHFVGGTPPGSVTIASLAGDSGSQVILDGPSTLRINGASDATFAGTLSGTGQLIHEGVGRLNLTSLGNALDSLQVSEGTLNIAGQVTGNVISSSQGRLIGNGTINGTVTGDGYFSPGANGGTMFVHGDFLPQGIVEFLVNRVFATPGVDHDQYIVDGKVDLSEAKVRLEEIESGLLTSLPVMTLIDNQSENPLDTVESADYAAGYTVTLGDAFYQLSYSGGSRQNDVVLTQVGGVNLSDDGTLTVYGSDSRDSFRVTESSGDIEVRASFGDVGSQRVTFDGSDVVTVIAVLYDGDDVADIRTSKPSIVLGGNGDDSLRMSGGVGILVGGRGKDSLRANDRPAILIGGDDEDRIIGSSEADLIIGGMVDHEANPAALSRALQDLVTDSDFYDAIGELDDDRQPIEDFDIDDMIGRGGLDELLSGIGDRKIQ